MMIASLGFVACGNTAPTASPPPSGIETVLVDTTMPERTTPDISTPATPLDASTSDTTPGEAPALEPLSAIDALLPPDSFPPPWEHQYTQTDPVNYDAGPNQSDCDPFWRYNNLQGTYETHTTWWIDGGNANQWVTRLPQREAAVLVADIATAPDVCPIVSWSEGDFFTVERLELGDGVVGFEMVTEPGRDRDWVAVTTHGDLVSTLWVPLWPSFDTDEFIDLSVDEFATIAQTMRARLLVAGPASPTELAPPTTQSTTARPEPPPIPVTSPPVPEIVPAPTSLPSVETPITVPDDPTGIAALLLTPDDLATTGVSTNWEFDRLEPHESSTYDSSTDDSSTESCPGLAAGDRIDEALTWSSALRSDDYLGVRQLIGDAGSTEQAARLVTEFAGIADCDLTALLDGDELAFPPRQVEGARIVYVEISQPGDERPEGTLVMAVDRYVTVLTVEVSRDRLDVYDELLQEVAELAAARMR